VPLSLVMRGSAVLVSTVVAWLIELLVPLVEVSAGVVHPLPLAFLSDLVHADPVRLVVANQSADQLVLSIVVDRDQIATPFHADELSSPPVIRFGYNLHNVFVLPALFL